jgi:hypothetical protein
MTDSEEQPPSGGGENARVTGRWLAAAAGAAVFLFGALVICGGPGEFSWTARAAVKSSVHAPSDAKPLLLGVDQVFVAAYLATGWIAFRLTIRIAEAIASIDRARYEPFARRVARWAQAGLVYVLIGAIADTFENALSYLILVEQIALNGSARTALTAAAWVKWLALAGGSVALLITLVSAKVRRTDMPNAEDPCPPWRAGRQRHPHKFDTDKREPRIGVSLSGGGIRSAAFSLGALQAISKSQIRPIRYITSVSGGGYMAAAWASLAGKDSVEAPFEPRSPEERWVRHHTDYLISSAGVVIGAALSLVGGLLVNLAIVFVLFGVVTHPLGWLLRAAHPELGATTIASIAEQPELAIDRAGVKTVSDVVVLKDDGSAGGAAAVSYVVPFTFDQNASIHKVSLKTGKSSRVRCGENNDEAELRIKPAIVIQSPKGLQVARQPVLVKACDLNLPPAAIRVITQPLLKVQDAPSTSAASTSAGSLTGYEMSRFLDLEQPKVRQYTGTVGRPDLNVRAWHWIAVAALGAAVAFAWIIDASVRRDETDRLLAGSHRVTVAIAKLAAAVAVLLVALPWLTRSLPGWIAELPGYDRDVAGWRAVSAFAVAAGSVLWRLRGSLKLPGLKAFRGRSYIFDGLIGAVIVALLASLFIGLVDIAAANGPRGRLAGIHDSWAGSHSDLRRWAFLCGALVFVLIAPASAHAWSMYTFYRSRLADAYMLTRDRDSVRQGAALPPSVPDCEERTPRVVPRRGKAVHDWQWHPKPEEKATKKKRKRWKLSRRDGAHTTPGAADPGARSRDDSPIGVDDRPTADAGPPPTKTGEGLKGPTLGRLSGSGHEAALASVPGEEGSGRLEQEVERAPVNRRRGRRARRRAAALAAQASKPTDAEVAELAVPKRPASVGPVEEWVVCTAVNIRGSGEAAPGRAAGSFTFSSEWVGGPEVGWMETKEYLKAINFSRDVSVPSTVTISGAAFSPAMGKMSKPWQGRLFALLNLRLGVWVPNPMAVRQGRKYHWLRGPNAAWYLRELVGWFDRTAPFVYLTDGGHWENLGLVELFRRGCTDIWMVSAAGDGTSSFETLGQALALAREEVGIEILELDLEPLRPMEEVRKDSPRRLLRKGKAVPTAPKTHVSGTFAYGDTTPGRITIIEAALVGDLPWDVHSYGERNEDFPDISTGYQLMDHRDFEAYRMLGQYQTSCAIRDRFANAPAPPASSVHPVASEASSTPTRSGGG